MFHKIAAENFLRSLEGITTGSLGLTLPDGRYYEFAGNMPGPRADIDPDGRAVEDQKLRLRGQPFGQHDPLL
ncbi:MAG: hypothetical protein KKA05_08760, partial [Alphaproteobacteria bacterium]|nr:hypothetical protein [Alphaproteobacteria bacterium]